jgi:hypothetical protein
MKVLQPFCRVFRSARHHFIGMAKSFNRSGHSARRSLPPVERAFDVVKAFNIYQPVGWRPSKVWVDAGMQATATLESQDRLSDLVYRLGEAVPGDQIHDCSGGLLLVDAALTCRAIRLAEPQALTVDTAYRHAEISVRADRAVADVLLRDGKVRLAAKVLRPSRPPPDSRDAELAFPEGHPLVLAP